MNATNTNPMKIIKETGHYDLNGHFFKTTIKFIDNEEITIRMGNEIIMKDEVLSVYAYKYGKVMPDFWNFNAILSIEIEEE